MKHNAVKRHLICLPGIRAAALRFPAFAGLVLSALVAGCGSGQQRELSYEEVMRLPDKGPGGEVRLAWSDNIGAWSDFYLRQFKNGTTNYVTKREFVICSLASQEALERIAGEATEDGWDERQRLLAIHSITNASALSKIARNVNLKEGCAADAIAAEAAWGVLVLGTPDQIAGLWASLDPTRETKVKATLLGDFAEAVAMGLEFHFRPQLQSGLAVVLKASDMRDHDQVKYLLRALDTWRLKDIYGEAEGYVVKYEVMQKMLYEVREVRSEQVADPWIETLAQTLETYPCTDKLFLGGLKGALENAAKKRNPDLLARIYLNSKSDEPALVAFELLNQVESDTEALAKMIAQMEAAHPDRAFGAAIIFFRDFNRKSVRTSHSGDGEIALMSELLTPDSEERLERLVYDSLVRDSGKDRNKEEFFLRANDAGLRRMAFDGIRDKVAREQLAKKSKDAANWSAEASIRRLYSELIMEKSRHADAVNRDIARWAEALDKIEEAESMDIPFESEAGGYLLGFKLGFFRSMNEKIPLLRQAKTKIEKIGADADDAAAKCKAGGMPETLTRQFSDLSEECGREARYIEAFLNRYNKVRR